MNPSLPPSSGTPLTASSIREAVTKLKLLDAYSAGASKFQAVINPTFTGMIGSLYGVNFVETATRSQFIDEFEADVQKEIKRRIK